MPKVVVPSRGSGELVLVVDDEAATLQMVEAVLRSRGYRVLTARGGAEALELYDRNRPEIRAVLLDMMMPDMDGLAVMSRFRERDPDIRIIGSSGLQVTRRAAEMLSANRAAFLPKPYSDGQLLAALTEILQRPNPAYGDRRPSPAHVTGENQ